MRSTVKRIGAAALVLALLPIAVADHGFADPDAGHPHAQRDAALPGEPMRYDPPPATSTGRPYTAKSAVWPAGAATVHLGRDRARAGALPVYVRSAGAATGGDLALEVLDRAATRAAGVEGLVLRLRGKAGATVHVDVDYRDFEGGYSGGAPSSLGLLELSGCTPMSSACTATPVTATNDVATRTVGADVPAAATLAVVEEPKGPAGDYTATPLKATSTWGAGGSAGDFTWQYPLRMPPGLNGPEPQLGLSYSSSSVDGAMAASNNQPSWLGEGFEMSTGAIERKYVSCASDMDTGGNNTTKTGDLCWKTDNAVLHLNGQSTELLKGSDGRWHGRSEDGARIELKTGADNGDHDGQWWVVTETDGTQYWFGRNQLPGWSATKATTNSAWTVPVFGNNTNEQCHAATFAASACDWAWRWNLDYVVDPTGNTMSYWYQTEKNSYAKAGSATTLASYVRGGWLDRIDYGTRSGTAYAGAPMQVDLGEADRCVTASCGTHDATNWPDTPWKMQCTASPCYIGSPTFWSTKRLGTLTTKVAGKPVDQWTFKHSFPDPGDTTRAGLWLDGISHTGLAGTTDSVPRTAVTVPDVHFAGVQKPNRVDATDFAPAMNWWRIATIETEGGGTINVTYADADCVAGSKVPDKTALWNNTLRCFPVYWTPEGESGLKLDYFHKYVVSRVTEQDNALPSDERSVPVVTSYEYPNPPAWRYTDDDGLVADKTKTWSVWRGYDLVRTITGTGADAVKSETTYFRGMDGDKFGTGTATRSVSLPAAGGAPAVTDSDFYAGLVREERAYQDSTGDEISATVSVPWRSDPPTATRKIDGVTAEARFVAVTQQRTRTRLDGGRGWRTTTENTVFDNSGLAIRHEELGDDAVTDDQSCTLTDYARNTTAWILDAVSRERHYAVDCAKAVQGTGLTEADVLSDTYTLYDNGARGAAPSKGLVTQTDELIGFPARYITQSKATYDDYGRVLSATDVRGNTTTTTYVPTSGGPVTGTVEETQQHWRTTTTFDPAWGEQTEVVDRNDKSTRQTFDALGRTTAVWLPNRPAGQSASVTFAYFVRKSGSVTVSNQLNSLGTGYRSSAAFLDGQGRTRQTQTAEGTTQGGRVITDTFYDSAGRQYKRNGGYVVDGALSLTAPTLVKHLDDVQVPGQTITAYDGAGRVRTSTFLVGNVEQWHTSTAYGGDRVDVVPPAGTMPTSTYTDALNRTVKVRQWHAALGSGDVTDLSYRYDRKAHLVEQDDNAGNAWTYTYDFAGHIVAKTDPDSGTSSSTYNDFGDLLTTTNGDGKVLVYTYDTLGRKLTKRADSATGTLLADWAYDSVLLDVGSLTVKGQQLSASSYWGGAKYTTRIDGMNDMYQPTGETITIPPSETGIAGTYSYSFAYTGGGADLSATMPSIGGLPREKLTSGYNTLGQLDTLKTNVSSTGDDVFLVNGTQYTRYGELSMIARRNGTGTWLDTAYDYEAGTRRLKRIHTTRETGPAEVADARIDYDPSGNVIGEQELVTGDRQCFGYDFAQRLTDAWTPAGGDCATAKSQSALGGPAPYWNSYAYDAVGNRTGSTERTTSTSVSRSYTYPAAKASQPHTLRSMTTTGGATAAYTYDKSGETLTRPANGTGGALQTLTWNSDGTLATSNDAGGTASYVYDAAGNRIIKHEPSGTTLSLPGQELRYAGGQATATRYLTHAGKTIGVRTTTGGLTWQVEDQQGTGTIEVNAATQAIVRRWLTPFGAERGGPATWVTDKGLVNGTKDGSGLLHLGAREYDQVTGRFISLDPVMEGDDAQALQGYNYANASPVTSSDPTGKMPAREPGGGSIGVRIGVIVAHVSKQVVHAIQYYRRGKQPVYQHYSAPRRKPTPPYQHYIPPRKPRVYGPFVTHGINLPKLPTFCLGSCFDAGGVRHGANPRAVCRSFNAGFSSPAACDEGFDAAERLRSGKSSQNVQLARGPKAYEDTCSAKGDETWCTAYKRPPAHVYVNPEHAVATEIALYAGETATRPGDAWTYHKEAHRNDGEWYLSVNVCIGLCVGVTITSHGDTFINGSITPGASGGSMITVGYNPQPMGSMRNGGAAYCAGAAVSGCATIGWDSTTGKPVYGGSASLGFGVKGGPTRTVSIPIQGAS
ncbi:RHS repeat-associated core domain-containing protein [Dactylosporangium sp. NPDC051541]|uniref:RHS repeat-associated core domain-containing protein n=1 Tax=Dactylosporangium sp. NPDC051541 TaxID=3363977 RepID=UPI0037A321B6